ncbi:MAG: type 1 glutamine amidotransferase [Phycisphaerales bacterium]|nr:type 1 glutamine amidotransferase [Planctomycetota bacterium]MCH8508802.1 type 1 glutamine amidotransferase [Phycisphaerales bacterium]
MARIVILQHNEHAHAGRLARCLRDHGFRLDIRRVDLPPEAGGKPVPSDLDNLHGLVVLGGAQNVDENHPFLAQEQALIRMAHEAGLPIVGICLGCQQIAKALGGRVARMAKPEVGMTPVHLNSVGQTETMLAGIPWSSPQLHSHAYEVVELPPGATLLGSTPACKVQSFRIGVRTFAFQHHFECDLPMAYHLMERSVPLAAEAGLTLDELNRQIDENAEMFDRSNDRRCENLATFAFTYHDLLAV